MKQIDVSNQAELDEALKKLKPAEFIVCRGAADFVISGSAQVTASDSARVRAYGSAQVTASDSARVRAYGSAQVTASDSARVRASGSAQVTASGSAQVTASDSARVRAYGSAQVTASDSARVRASGSAQVRAYGSAQVTASDSAQVTASDSARVRAYGSAQVTASDSAQVTASDSAQVRAYGSAQVTASDSARVRAYGSAQVTASDSAQVTASRFVAVTRHGTLARVKGGRLIEIPPIRTASDWCEFYGAEVVDGLVTLFKATRDDYRSAHGFLYEAGSAPAAPDWDGGERECGGGLHFCASPHEALGFDGEATRFIACPVRIDEIVVHENASYPNKVKAPRVAAPCWEVDINGARIERAEVAP